MTNEALLSFQSLCWWCRCQNSTVHKANTHAFTVFSFLPFLQVQEDHEKVAEQISRDVSQLCTQLASLWSRFLDAALLNPHILSYLAQEHHTLRVRASRHRGPVAQATSPLCFSSVAYLNVASCVSETHTKIKNSNKSEIILELLLFSACV